MAIQRCALLTLIALAGCATTIDEAPTDPIVASTTVPGPAKCSEAYTSHNEFAIAGVGTGAPFSLYQEICDGGLYVVSHDTKRVLVRINEMWWLEEINSATWDAATSELTVRAHFITGIGPTGTVPFAATFKARQQPAGNWLVEESTDGGPLVTRDGFVEISSQAQLDALALSQRGQPVALEIDFETTRLALQAVWLTSGMMTINKIRVARGPNRYFVTYTTQSPRIVTNDMSRAVIYVVLPRDHRGVSFEDPEPDARPVSARTGALMDANFVGYPTP